MYCQELCETAGENVTATKHSPPPGRPRPSSSKKEFDPSDRRSLCETLKDVLAMANSGGGVIVVGVDGQGRPTGKDVKQPLDTDPADLANKPTAFTGRDFDALERADSEEREDLVRRRPRPRQSTSVPPARALGRRPVAAAARLNPEVYVHVYAHADTRPGLTGNAALGDDGGMVSRDLLRLKPETRRRAWRLFKVILDVYKHRPEAIGTVERVLGALEAPPGRPARRSGGAVAPDDSGDREGRNGEGVPLGPPLLVGHAAPASSPRRTRLPR